MNYHYCLSGKYRCYYVLCLYPHVKHNLGKIASWSRRIGMSTLRFARLIGELPASVPFVGPENLERSSGRTFLSRIGANENVFGPSSNRPGTASDGPGTALQPNAVSANAIPKTRTQTIITVCLPGWIDRRTRALTRQASQPATKARQEGEPSAPCGPSVIRNSIAV